MRCKGLRGKSVEGMEVRQNGPSIEIGGFALEQHPSEKKKKLLRLLYAWHFDIFYRNNPICISQDKENHPTRQEHAGTKGDNTNYTFPTHSQMSTKQSKVAATYSGAGIRAEAKKSKVVFKNVLDTPFNIPW